MRLEPLKAWAIAARKKPRAGYNARVRGGDYRCQIYWTKKMAKCELKNFPECEVVEVIINQIFR